MRFAVSLLRFHQIDALPIGSKRLEKKRYAVAGYATLSRLLETKPSQRGRFLDQPCESVALELSIISDSKDIESLIQVFESTKFGFAWVEGKSEVGGFAGLRDLLSLYENSILSTNLSVDDVASPIVSLPANSTLKQTIEEMFDRRIRRMFVADTDGVISDRKIIDYLFSTARLTQVQKNIYVFSSAEEPETLLDAKLGDLDAIHPEEISSESSIKEAAMTMAGKIEECLICKKGVLTPWDLIMKPWLQGKLTISS